MRYFDPLKGALHVVVWGVVFSYILVSVVFGQIAAPYYFRLVDRDPVTSLPFIKAIVKTGDLSLLKTAFPVSVNNMFEQVFERYVLEDSYQNTLNVMSERVSESRDLEVAKGYLALRENNMTEASMHFQKAKEIDPLVFVPLSLLDASFTSNANP
ncbi:MAG: hypothetical protein U0525_04375 [Patescibacteria group bacterium]